MPRRPSVWSFFLLTFAITWGLQVPGVLAQRGLLPGAPEAYLPFVGLGIFGPLAAATFLARREGGRVAVRQLYAGLLRWRVHPGWYLAALAPAALLAGVLGLLSLVGRQGPVAYLPAIGGLVFGIVISIEEEVGWRGYAQPRLEERFGTFAAAGLVGVAWYLWHLPMFLGQGVPMNLVLLHLLFFCGGSFFLAWLRQRTGGSLLVVSLAHLAAHLNNSHRALPGDVVPYLVHAILYGLLGLVVLRAAALSPTVGRIPTESR